ncbi:hypothetical protein ACIA5G_39990 [Amycolatopsis sp. NPDC051758]|uniref:hypothetical protein n=1 Tax=Amycolatopsis sp. NPDC051758 TaxID=3363935 RepID=UPI003792CB13
MPLRYQFLVYAGLTILIKLIMFLCDGTMPWWLATIIALVVGAAIALITEDFWLARDDATPESGDDNA